ncbi:MAG: hypothetical protein ACRDHL_11065, partial [Candidatus Promineifilaceae bacterium]
MSSQLTPLVWVVLTLPILLLLQRWIHRHLHGVAYLLTGNRQWAVLLYAIVLFPGVLLHEASHWLSAKLLGVRTGAFSIVPQLRADGAVQLGYVEYYKSKGLGPLRESLIGSAPLITGTLVVLFISFRVFDVNALASAFATGSVDALTVGLTELLATADFLVWLYLIFAISNAMMPSSSDRRAWPLFALLLAAAAGVVYLLDLDLVLI